MLDPPNQTSYHLNRIPTALVGLESVGIEASDAHRARNGPSESRRL